MKFGFQEFVAASNMTQFINLTAGIASRRKKKGGLFGKKKRKGIFALLTAIFGGKKKKKNVAKITKTFSKVSKNIGKLEKSCPGVTAAAVTAGGTVIAGIASAIINRRKKTPVEENIIIEIGGHSAGFVSYPGMYRVHIDDLEDKNIAKAVYYATNIREMIRNKGKGNEDIDVSIVMSDDIDHKRASVLMRALKVQDFACFTVDC